MSMIIMELRGPQMLKDFLADDESNSCSSNGFQSFPRKPCESTVRNLLQLHQNTIKLTRSRSKAASATISVLHKASEIFSNAVKHLPFKSPSVRQNPRDHSVTVKVKDILRWRSFRDLVDEKSTPLDFSSSPLRCTTSTRTTTTVGSSSCSPTTSWCDSDFTAEDLPFWPSNNYYYEEGKKGVVGDSTVDPKRELSCEEKEQHSPVSVLNFPFQEDEELSLSSHQSLPKLEPEEDYDDHEEYGEGDNTIKEKAQQMLNHVKAASSMEACEASVDRLLLDFFSHELTTSRNIHNDYDVLDWEMLRVAKAWVSGQHDESFEWDVVGKREVCVREMERKGRWSKFEEEQEELAWEIEVGVLDDLVDELLVDLSCSLKRFNRCKV